MSFLSSFVLSSAHSSAYRRHIFDPVTANFTLRSGWTLTLLATRGPPLVTWRWALRDEGDDHDGRAGQYSGDQDHPASF